MRGASLLVASLVVGGTALVAPPPASASIPVHQSKAGATVVRGDRVYGLINKASVAAKGRPYSVKVVEYPDAKHQGGDPACVARRQAKHQRIGAKDCGVIVQAGGSAAQVVPAARAAQLLRQRSGGVTRQVVYCPCIVHSRSSWQRLTAVNGTWREEHKFRFYYDGVHVWFKPRGSYNKGVHRCGYGWGIGVSVDITDCGHSPDYDTDYVVLRDRFKVSLFIHGFPVAKRWAMHVNIHPSGYIGSYKN